jgi:hypothetical protein
MIKIHINGEQGMDSIIDLTKSRKARQERGESFRAAAGDLLLLLERQRQNLSEEYMTFLIAMAVSDQAIHYAGLAQSPKAGQHFIDHLFTTARQIFETHCQEGRIPPRIRTRTPEAAPRVVELGRQPARGVSEQPLE